MLGDASPFDFAAAGAHEKWGVLCIHGFTGTPFEMRYLGERLAARGFHAVGPALPGHISTPDRLDETRWTDWLRCVEDELDRLRARCDRVAVVGQSLGGLLALRLAQTRGHDIAAVASLAAPLWLSGLAHLAARATRPGTRLGAAVRQLPKLGGSDVRDPAMKRANRSYRVVPVRALHQLIEFMQLVRSDLAAVRVPTLVMHGRRDHVAPYPCSEEIIARVQAPVRTHRALEQSFHLVAIDVEREIVADEVANFFASQLRAAGSLTQTTE